MSPSEVKVSVADLQAGDRVKVRMTDGARVSGVMSSVTDDIPEILSILLPPGRLIVRDRGNGRGRGVKSVRLVLPRLPVKGRSARDASRSGDTAAVWHREWHSVTVWHEVTP